MRSVLADLDPGSRALLDLSVRRGLDDQLIADFLATDPTSVAERRTVILDDVARQAGAATDEDVDAVRAALIELRPGDWGTAAPKREEPPEPALPPMAELGPTHRRAPLVLALLALAAVGAVIAMLVTSGTDEEKVTSGTDEEKVTSGTGEEKDMASTARPTATSSPPPSRPPAVTKLRSLGGTGSGTAMIDGTRLNLNVKALADPGSGAYEIWLYNSIDDAKSIASFARRSIDLDAKLPGDASKYRYMDISLEPKDGNPNHSGQSVLRVPVSRLGG